MAYQSVPATSYRAFSDLIHRKAIDRRMPIDGTIELTHRCNLRCAHCYCLPESGRAELGRSEICRIIDEIAEAGCLWLLFTGGEPLLRPDFFDIYLHAKRRGLLITLFSNATLIDERVVDILAEYPPFFMEVSVYGMTEETYEKVTRVKGSYGAFRKGLDLIRERGLPLKLKTMALTLNAHEMEDMEGWARGLGFEFRFDSLVHPRIDGSREPCAYRLSPRQAVSLDAANEEKREKMEYACKEAFNTKASDRLFECSGGTVSFHIDPYGQLRPCDMVREIRRDLGAADFANAWADLEADVTRRKIPAGFRCEGCVIAGMCNQCPGWAFLENGDMHSISEHMCEIAHLRADTFGAKKEGANEEVVYEEEAISKA